jgi:hypothetical protein
MWKLKNFAEGADKNENALRMKSMLEGLKSKIKEIRKIEVGISMNDSTNSYDIVLYSEFENADALKKYQKHPEHAKAGDFIGKVRLKRKVVDYEV